ncbi:YbaB/EbfC family nucleoid-associated protein [Dactylosporangium sp. CA-092794]|uniref:YbaB/EbfC family nucleoid-associated protein n=1 Tax=Dactylosporangium sp. CA-092794 TaxID=3239929 RepID=UPI003D8A6329
MSDQVEQALAEFEATMKGVRAAQRDLEAVRTTVTAKSRAVTVVVDAGGDVMEVRFPTHAFRTMPPAELGRLLVETIADARTQARRAAVAAFGEFLPAGAAAHGLFDGGVDFERVVAEAYERAAQPLPLATDPDRSDES